LKIIPQHRHMKKLNKILKMTGIYLTGFVGGLIAIYCLLCITDEVVMNFEKYHENRIKHKTYPVNSHDAAYAWMEEKVIINF